MTEASDDAQNVREIIEAHLFRAYAVAPWELNSNAPDQLLADLARAGYTITKRADHS